MRTTYFRWTPSTVGVVMCGVLIVISGLCCTSSLSSSSPAHVVKLDPSLRYAAWGAGGQFLWALPRGSRPLYVWQWENGAVLEFKQVPIEWSYRAALIGDGTCVSASRSQPPKLDGTWMDMFWAQASSRDTERTIVLRYSAGDSPIRRYTIEPGWFCRLIGVSRNGRFTAIGLTESPPSDMDHPQLHVAIVPDKKQELNWLQPLTASGGGWNPRRIVPSEDGSQIAIAGWANGVAMVDVGRQQLAWEIRPKSEVNTNCVAFSPDGKVLYSAGSEGCVYSMEVSSGKIMDRWFASNSGASEYGHGIEYLAVSPDGRFVAAATVPNGTVYLWDMGQPGKLRILEPGSPVSLVTFSPDCKSLAVVVDNDAIRIWPVGK